ncbi:MAG TPA: hypothetical protein VK601_16535, partial [Kofleriaceae bacterium]|nr:hypothetical protein [Kofleriaceae bacterium]
MIDDMAEIHEVFHKLLGAKRSTDQLVELESALFGPGDTPPSDAAFEVDSALQGEEGLARVHSALTEHRR